MNCHKCGSQIPDIFDCKINYCPFCGERLIEAGKKYLVRIQSNFSGDETDSKMLVFVDDRELYEINPHDNISFTLLSGFHALKFKYKNKSRNINLMATSNYVIRVNVNSLSGLIETNILKANGSSEGLSESELASLELTQPVMVSQDGSRSLDVLTGNDEPLYELRASSGLKEGLIRIYDMRIEFSSGKDSNKEVTYFSSVEAVKSKMGSIELRCEGNVRKVYSIPKDSYNEVMAFLTNRIAMGK